MRPTVRALAGDSTITRFFAPTPVRPPPVRRRVDPAAARARAGAVRPRVLRAFRLVARVRLVPVVERLVDDSAMLSSPIHRLPVCRCLFLLYLTQWRRT